MDEDVEVDHASMTVGEWKNGGFNTILKVHFSSSSSLLACPLPCPHGGPWKRGKPGKMKREYKTTRHWQPKVLRSS